MNKIEHENMLKCKQAFLPLSPHIFVFCYNVVSRLFGVMLRKSHVAKWALFS